MDTATENTNIIPEETPEEIKKRPTKQLWAIGIVAVLIVVVVITFFSLTNTHPSTPMVTYTDPLNYVSISVPKDWQTDREEGNNTTGLNTAHPTSQTIEIFQLYQPANKGITIQVIEGVPTCPLDQPLNTTFAGFPASYDSQLETWTIPTTKATVSVSIAYPGSNSIHSRPMQKQPTPIPSVMVEQNKTYMMELLKTFKLTNLTPFKCS